MSGKARADADEQRGLDRGPLDRGADLAVVFWPQTALLVPGVTREPREPLDRARELARMALDAALDAVGVGSRILVVTDADRGNGERDGAGLPNAPGPSVLRLSAEEAFRERALTEGRGTLAGVGVERSVGLRSGRIDHAAGIPAGEACFSLPATVALLLLEEFGQAERISVLEASAPGMSAPGEGIRPFGAPTVLIVCGDGSARSTEGSPGRFDPAAAAFDDELAEALRTADLQWFLKLERSVAERLQASGDAAWSFVANLLAGGAYELRSSRLLGRMRPFGVEYLFAAWTASSAVQGLAR